MTNSKAGIGLQSFSESSVRQIMKQFQNTEVDEENMQVNSMMPAILWCL
jgi:hypothetical protein